MVLLLSVSAEIVDAQAIAWPRPSSQHLITSRSPEVDYIDDLTPLTLE
jgi:hypothetical protein